MIYVDRVKVLYRHWVQNVDAEQVSLHEWACDTQACLAGHACFVPKFREQGLQLVRWSFFGQPTPTFGDLTAFEAIVEFFGKDARCLFQTRGTSELDDRIRARFESGAAFDRLPDYDLAQLRMEFWLNDHGVNPQEVLR